MNLAASSHVHYAGSAMVLAMIVGGGTEQGLWSDHLVELFLLPAFFMGVAGFPASRLGVLAKALMIATTLIMLVQLIPVPAISGFPQTTMQPAGLSFWSPAPGRSLEAALFMFSALGFVSYLSRFNDEDQYRLYRYFGIGLLVNVSVALVQLSYASRVMVTGLLPFEITSGLFANENHMSSLIYMSIPLVGYRYLVRARKPLLFLTVSVGLFVVLFAIGSRAGMIIGPVLAVVAAFWLVADRFSVVIKLSTTIFCAATAMAVVWYFGLYPSIGNELRVVINTTMLRAIADNILFGTGVGTFRDVYPGYDSPENIIHLYVNQAHNDYLQILLETGLAGALAIATFAALLIASMRRSMFAQAAFLAAFAICLHSMVEYPLRTFAIAIPFAWLCAVILSTTDFGEKLLESRNGTTRSPSRTRQQAGALQKAPE